MGIYVVQHFPDLLQFVHFPPPLSLVDHIVLNPSWIVLTFLALFTDLPVIARQLPQFQM
jgi:hypothetical protein